MADVWFTVARGAELAQGDILLGCPVLTPYTSLDLTAMEAAANGTSTMAASVPAARWDLVILTHSCDLVASQKPAEIVLCCPVYQRSSLLKEHPLSSNSRFDEARKGRIPNVCVLDKCEIAGHERGVSIAFFNQLITLPYAYLTEFADKQGARLRLQSPYKEHLSQAFGRLFMRVALPKDVDR